MTPLNDIQIQGHCDQKFRAVRDAFTSNFTSREDIGASTCVIYEGKVVVDLWGGHIDAARTKAWQQETLVNGWSLGKAMSALATIKLMESGVYRPETRVCDIWPEFATADKGDINFAMLMSHQAGLCAIEAPLPDDAFYHWDVMTKALASQKPWWEPGSAHGYHTNTFGFLLGEPVRRVTGKRMATFFQDEIARPLNTDFFMGVPTSELFRCADLINPPRPATARQTLPENPDLEDPLVRMRYRTYNNPDLGEYEFNSSNWRTAEFPSTSPQCNARGVAKIFGELAAIIAGKADGIVSREMLTRAIQIESDGQDLNIQRPTRFGLGFQLTQPDRPLGPNPGSFGHYGNGGHLGFADPDANIGFAYHMNHQGYAWRDPRNIALTDAVYASL